MRRGFTATCRAPAPTQGLGKLRSRVLTRGPLRVDPTSVSEEHEPADRLPHPERSRVGPGYGFACDPNVVLVATSPTRMPTRHEGCAGWWPSRSDPDVIGWCCPCECHERGAGWPGYEQARAHPLTYA